MADIQHYSGVISPVATNTNRCGGHISWGSAPSDVDPWGIWWDTDDKCLKINDEAGVSHLFREGYSFLANETIRKQSKTNVTTVQDMVTFTALSAGLLNVANRHLIVESNGYFVAAAGQVAVLDFTLYPFILNSNDCLKCGPLTESVTGAFRMRFDIVTDTTGINGQCTVTAKLDIELAGDAVPAVITNAMYGVSGALLSEQIDLTVAVQPKIQVKSLIQPTSVIYAIDSRLQVV